MAGHMTMMSPTCLSWFWLPWVPLPSSPWRLPLVFLQLCFPSSISCSSLVYSLVSVEDILQCFLRKGVWRSKCSATLHVLKLSSFCPHIGLDHLAVHGILEGKPSPLESWKPCAIVAVASKNARTRATLILDPLVGDLSFHSQKHRMSSFPQHSTISGNNFGDVPWGMCQLPSVRLGICQTPSIWKLKSRNLSSNISLVISLFFFFSSPFFPEVILSGCWNSWTGPLVLCIFPSSIFYPFSSPFWVMPLASSPNCAEEVFHF